MNTFERVEKARIILELPEQATLKEIKKNHKRLLKKWHPDHCQEEPRQCQEMAIRINEAYSIICTYLEKYKFSFARDEVEKYSTDEEWWVNRFGDDPLWGPGGK